MVPDALLALCLLNRLAVSLREAFRGIKGIPKLHRPILLDEARAVEGLVLLPVYTEFDIRPAKREPYNPIQFRGIGLTARFPVREQIHVPVHDDPILIKIQIRMGDIPKERLPGIVRSGEIIAIVKEPTGSGIGREVLLWK